MTYHDLPHPSSFSKCCVTTRHLEVFERRYTDLHHDPFQGSDHALHGAIYTPCAGWAISAGLASIFSQSSKAALLLKVKGLLLQREAPLL